MKYKTLTRILIQILGVYFLAQSASSVVNGITQFIAMTFIRGSGRFDPFNLIYLIAPVLYIVVGLSLFYRSNWIANKIIPSNRPYCPDCGYDLTNNPSPQCPECGTSLPSSATSTKTP